MSLRNFLLSLMTFSLLSCASTARYERVMQEWVGKSTKELLDAKGPPHETLALQNGHMGWIYEVRSSLEFNQQPTIDQFGTKPTVGSSITQEYFCRTTFEVADDRIVGFQWQGTQCVD